MMHSRSLVIRPVADWTSALNEIQLLYPNVSCFPDINILPERTYDNVAVIECLQNREQHTSYLTAWLPDDRGYPVYLIYLFERKGENCYFKGLFEGINKYYDYCRQHLKDIVHQDFGNALQFEYLL